jgi:hypothetical protein
MRLAGAAEQHSVALLLQEGAAGEIAHRTLVDRGPGKPEVG